jgi:predicted nuclease with TOPRIM domain
MQAKRTVTFFILLLLLSMLPCSVKGSSNTTVSLRGDEVMVYLTYPEEARSNTTITHNITITSSTTVTLRNFTVVVKALVDSSWQEILNGKNEYGFPPELPQTYTLTLPLPQNASGMLQCFIFFNTSSIDNLSTTLYTSLVSEPTFSEMQVLYYEMLANYTILQEDYEALLEEYDGLLVNYSSLLANYTALLTEYDVLSGLYDDQVLAYEKLLSKYDTLSDDYEKLEDDFESKSNDFGVLQTDFNDLNETHYELQANYTSLETSFKGLNASYTGLSEDFESIQNSLNDKQGELDSDKIVMLIFVISVAVLIAFIVYLKRKKEDPYLVIRKETVSMKSDKET